MKLHVRFDAIKSSPFYVSIIIINTMIKSKVYLRLLNEHFSSFEYARWFETCLMMRTKKTAAKMTHHRPQTLRSTIVGMNLKFTKTLTNSSLSITQATYNSYKENSYQLISLNRINEISVIKIKLLLQ